MNFRLSPPDLSPDRTTIAPRKWQPRNVDPGQLVVTLCRLTQISVAICLVCHAVQPDSDLSGHMPTFHLVRPPLQPTATYPLRCPAAYIYIRGEFYNEYLSVEQAVQEAYKGMGFPLQLCL